MRTKSLAVLAVMLAFPALALAGPFGAGAHVSNFKASDAQEGKTFVGGHARLRLGGGLGIEASVDYREDTYVSDVQTVTIKSVPLLLSLQAEVLPSLPVTPYLLGGGGWYFTKIEVKTGLVEIDDDQVQFGWHLGGGVAVKPTPRVVIHADYRYTSVDFELEHLKIDATGRMITAGVTIFF